jgi:hypothetical protein
MKRTYRKLFDRRFRYLLVLVLIASYIGFTPAYGAVANDFKDTLSDSRPSTDANHTIQFFTPTGVESSSDTITIEFASSGHDFTVTSTLDYTDIDLASGASCSGAVDKTLSTSTAAGVWGVAVNTSTDTITFTAPSDAAGGEITAGHCVVIEIGTNATSGATGDKQITNPTAGVYNVDVAGAFGDSNRTKVAIVDGVGISVTVPSLLVFQVLAVNGADCPITSSINSSATAIDFGTIAQDDFNNACQKLRIGTNAADGYTVTVQTSQLLKSGSDEIPKGTCDGSCSDTTGAAWANAVNSSTGDTNDGFGYCMKNVLGDGATTADSNWGTYYCGAGTTYFKTIANAAAGDTARAILSSAARALDVAHIEYRLNVAPDQPEGSYTTTVVYVATPQFD